jgi:hypothetical protein
MISASFIHTSGDIAEESIGFSNSIDERLKPNLESSGTSSRSP